MPWTKKFRNSLGRFANDTTIHGVKDLFSARSLGSKIFWAVVELLALCLTIFHICKTVGHYRHQTTMTTVRTVPQGELLLPDLMLCYEHWVYWVDWKKVSRLGFTKETTLYGLSFISTIYSDTRFDINSAKRDFERKMKTNNMTKLSEFYKSIAYSTPPRVFLPDNVQQRWFKVVEFSFYEPVSLCYVTPGAQLAVDTRQRFFGSQATFLVENEPFNSFNRYLSRLEYSSYMHFMLVKEGLLKFKPQQQQVDFADVLQLPIWIHANKKHQDGVMISSDISAYTITVSASVRVLQNRREKPCREMSRMANNDIECNFRCYSQGYYNNTCNKCLLVQLAMALDQDTPETVCQNEMNLLTNNANYSAMSSLTGDASDGAIEWHSSGTENITNDLSTVILKPVKHCVDETLQQKCKDENCVPACELWDFDKSVSAAMYPKYLHTIADQARTTVLVNYPIEDSIFVMSEVDSLTWDGLVANIGGLLGIWLGASIVSFLQMLYRCCACLTDSGQCPEGNCQPPDASTCLPFEKSKEKGKAVIVRHTTKDEHDNFV